MNIDGVLLDSKPCICFSLGNLNKWQQHLSYPWDLNGTSPADLGMSGHEGI